MRLTQISAPTESPVTLDDIKAFARVDSAHEDSVLQAHIEAAVNLLDGPTGILGRAIVTQTWLLELPAWPASLVIPVEPVQSVSVSYLDADGVERTVDAGAYYISAYPGQAPVLHWATSWSAPALAQDGTFPVRLEIVAGFGPASSVPAALAQAIMMMVTHWFDNRDLSGQIPLTASAMLARYRRVL